MTKPIISVENLGKRYRVKRPGSRGGGGLRHAIEAGAASLWNGLSRIVQGRAPYDRIAPEDEFWALKDINFEVQAGECVGIIGRNGAGKSTLLKILSRITEPSTGRAVLRGRVGSLLEVGTGFHPELTGRENIFLNGAILGMRRHEINKRMDEIVAFAEVDEFLDTPVKHYSSGMYMRLAFAVAAHLDPEILIVDEVLAVGDVQFQKKCLGKMSEVAKDGRTVLFVSHNMAAVQSLCKIGVLLEQGSVVQVGLASEAVTAYLANGSICGEGFNTSGRQRKPTNCEIIDAWIERDGVPTQALLFGERADIIIVIQVVKRIKFAIEMILRQQDGLAVKFAPSGLAFDWEIDQAPGSLKIRCQLPPMRFASGGYSIDLITACSGKEFYDYIESGLRFTVDSSAVGERNWMFNQSRNQGYSLWEVNYQVDQNEITQGL